MKQNPILTNKKYKINLSFLLDLVVNITRGGDKLIYNLKKFTQDFSYTFLYNIFSMFVSAVLIFLAPKFIGVAEYGYWQLYILYCSYFNYLSFGLTEGIYLRYGGEEYNDLPKPIFCSQFWLLVILEFIITFFIAIIYLNVSFNTNKMIVVFLVCLSTIITIPRGFLAYTLQATGRIKSCMTGYFSERVVYLTLAVILLFLGLRKFEVIIMADIIGKLVSIIYLIKISKDIVFNKPLINSLLFSEIQRNISAGSKLLFANLSSILIVGIIRFTIENQWGIEAFGNVSLTMSISNMLISFFSAISIVLFPMLRKTSNDNLINIYLILNRIITILNLGLLILYFPLKSMLLYWLPNYSESMIYMGFLLPMCIYESKMTLLFTTYLKTFRKEKELLYINLITVILSIIISYINVAYLENLNLMVFSIVLLLSFRSIIAELYISRFLNLFTPSDIISQVLVSGLFIFMTWSYSNLSSFVVYLVIYIIYLVLKRNDIYFCFKYLKKRFST